VYRENVREWLLWALFSRTPDLALPEWEEEIDSYIERIESSVGKTYERGRNKTNSIRIAFDTVAMVHRPLVWYLVRELQSTMIVLEPTLRLDCFCGGHVLFDLFALHWLSSLYPLVHRTQSVPS